MWKPGDKPQCEQWVQKAYVCETCDWCRSYDVFVEQQVKLAAAEIDRKNKERDMAPYLPTGTIAASLVEEYGTAEAAILTIVQNTNGASDLAQIALPDLVRWGKPNRQVLEDTHSDLAIASELGKLIE